jgi:hypothetical protein
VLEGAEPNLISPALNLILIDHACHISYLTSPLPPSSSFLLCFLVLTQANADSRTRARSCYVAEIWHLPLVARHNIAELSIYHSIIFTRRTVVPFSISCLQAYIDSICLRLAKHYQDQRASSMKIACFQVEPHWVHAVQQLRTRLLASSQWPAVDLGLSSRERNLSILVIHASEMHEPFYMGGLSCALFSLDC